MDKAYLILICFIWSFSSFAKEKDLKSLFHKTYKTKKERSILKEKSFEAGGKAIPILIDVMKTSSYPDDNRWMATYILGELMGDKGAPFIAKFTRHPKWFMRLASLKALLLMKKKDYKALYAQALKDPSLIVRAQALDNITSLKIEEMAPLIWNMLYDESNYAGSKNALKRTQMIRDIILAMGYLNFQKVKPALLKMAVSQSYSDIFETIDYSLSLLTGKKSPKHRGAKKIFWKKMAIGERIIK